MKSSGRGGARDGGGRPSKWQNTPTVTIRVPKIYAKVLEEVAHKLDEGQDEIIVIDPKDLKVEQQVKKERLSLSHLRIYKQSGHKVIRVEEFISALNNLLQSD